MPSLGPIQVSLQVYLAGHLRTPHGNSTSDESIVSFSEERDEKWEKQTHSKTSEKPDLVHFI